MSLYEGMFLMDNRQANRDWDGCLASLKGILEKHGADVQRVDKWGERRLAYEMKGRRRGTYVLTYFTAVGSAVTEIYRECELSELMLRALILKVEKIPEESGSADSSTHTEGAAPAKPATAAPAATESDETAEDPEEPKVETEETEKEQETE